MADATPQRTRLTMRREYRINGRGRFVYVMMWIGPALALLTYPARRRRWGPDGGVDPLALAVVLLPIVALVYLLVLLTVTRITVGQDGALTFHRALGIKTVAPHDVVRISLGALVFSNLTFITHSGGRVVVLQPMTGFHEIVTLVKTANPSVDLSGI